MSASKPVGNQVSTKNTEEYSNKIVYLSKLELGKLYRQMKHMQ